MRRWSVGSLTYGPESLPAGNGWSPDGPASVTPELVYELPAVARISQFVVTAGLPAGPPARIDVGVSTANDRDFTPAGTVTLTPQGGAVVNASLAGTFSARWVRVRFTATPGKALQVSSISAFGTLPVPPAKIAGRWSLAENDLGYQDAVFAKVKGMIPNDSPAAAYYQLATAFVQNEFVATTCTYDRAVWRGSADGATASIDGGGALVAVAGGRLLVGRIGADKILARRVARAPGCDVPPVGRGPLVVVLARHPADELDVSDPKLIPGHRFVTHLLPEVTPQDLNGASAAVLALSCNVGKDTTAAQQTDLLDFVRRGRVLIVRDADRCSQSAYDFIPYPFETAATGARGARGNVLQIVDSSVLASNDPQDRAHFVDAAAYLKNPNQQLGDADVMKTDDRHWCGLAVAENAGGATGFVRAYARLGAGLIVYDGFDVDDLRAAIPQALLLNRLAYGISPGADLPCNAKVASHLVLIASQRREVPFGAARDFRFAFRLDHQGVTAPESVTLALTGEHAPGWRAKLERSQLSLGASPQRILVAIHVPANATAARHLFTLTATGSTNQSAQAAIEFDVNEALAKELRKKGGRARIYGIHFDVASAHIQGQSQATIREIADVLRANPAWNMRIEGYTDSDGGAAYNLGLSRRRAQAVVDELVARYRIARRRLRAYGYGLTRPVASNATDAGKALNRRVELARD